MLSRDLIGTLSALTAALFWGSGDFTGGWATRRTSQFHVLVVSALSGIAVLLLSASLWRESWPSTGTVGWAALAGISGTVGIAALYHALSLGHAASVAPTAAVVSVVLPVIFSGFTEGWPKAPRLAGFVLALFGIWLVCKPSAGGGASRPGLGAAVLAGVGFAGFFVLIAQVEAGAVFGPLIVARSVELMIAVLLLRARGSSLPRLRSHPAALVAGLLDAGGNVFYLLAQGLTRLDIAVVLSSLYPLTTVLLARFILKQKIMRVQWIGAAVCLLAIELIVI
jgi:drug/metabolite transporter (DMT)-like permease